jgi:hypothetical protein
MTHFLNFKKLPEVNNHEMGENSPNLFALLLTLQVQVAHRLNPHGGMYGCHLVPAWWNCLSPSNQQPWDKKVLKVS